MKAKSEGKEVAEALATRIRFRRFLHLLCKEMGLKLDSKNADKVKKSLESFRKKADEATKWSELSKRPEGVFN